MQIDGNTEIIAHIGFPTHAFKAPLIYNPWFETVGINAIVVPMSCQVEPFPRFLRSLFHLGNLRGALITMPHKVSTVGLLDEVLPTAAIAGSCNAVRRLADGRLQGDMFDGEGFVRGIRRKGFEPKGRRALVVGAGGVGCAIAASLAAAGVLEMGLYDVNNAAAQGLANRLLQHYPDMRIQTGSNDPAEVDLLVNATPMGMKDGDPLPVDMDRVDATTFVGEVVMKTDMTAFLKAAQARGCRIQIGSDMLYEQIPAYLEYFGYPVPTPEELRAAAHNV
ncbi:shikimate dehydrogenase [Rhodoferax sp. U2-2l]|uniref:shikimate dehydrogenase family protein n=1 Tax=Rhodoferax sp. U2-2l TaxID=2884000 RepID=UPI001D0AFD70|nr:shikimate dehydrogenase [Rhodoferax sp. U2-2l]MCB8747352.1 shikimate dehydrogenase [Rhodoferax sp. U2-2l]